MATQANAVFATPIVMEPSAVPPAKAGVLSRDLKIAAAVAIVFVACIGTAVWYKNRLDNAWQLSDLSAAIGLQTPANPNNQPLPAAAPILPDSPTDEKELKPAAAIKPDLRPKPVGKNGAATEPKTNSNSDWWINGLNKKDDDKKPAANKPAAKSSPGVAKESVKNKSDNEGWPPPPPPAITRKDKKPYPTPNSRAKAIATPSDSATLAPAVGKSVPKADTTTNSDSPAKTLIAPPSTVKTQTKAAPAKEKTVVDEPRRPIGRVIGVFGESDAPKAKPTEVKHGDKSTGQEKSASGLVDSAADRPRKRITAPEGFGATDRQPPMETTSTLDELPSGSSNSKKIEGPGGPRVIARAVPVRSAPPTPAATPADRDRTADVETVPDEPQYEVVRASAADRRANEQYVAIAPPRSVPRQNEVRRAGDVRPATNADDRVKVVSYDVDTYIVLEGDSFDSIAKSMYGQAELGLALMEYNRSRAGRKERLTPGVRLRMPPAEVLRRDCERQGRRDAALTASAGGDPAAALKDRSAKTPLPAAPRADAAAPKAPVTVVAKAVQEETRKPIGDSPAAKAGKDDKGPTYAVTTQETLYAIARKTLGDSKRWREIYQLNTDRLPNEYEVPVGTTLRLPADAAKRPK